ncbi:MAG TPA: pyruvate, phosphate dikinase [Anaerolineae bacterium]|mgnify:CR=1 FL=1|nr:pyruvate, phosphate dikinase [Anaerolineae bacterium]HQK12786.1 pyruvate, phosphate dikinase [Anaerolineae bacterium]
MSKQWVYLARNAKEDYAKNYGHTPSLDEMKVLFGGKGAGLIEMTSARVPVPPTFTITTEACVEYMNTGKFPEGMWEQALEALKDIEAQTGKKFGDPNNPLLVSVRSGARTSMPGMMDTVLNLGLNEETRAALARLTGNEWFSYDAYRRFIVMFSDIVMGYSRDHFEKKLDELKEKEGAQSDAEVSLEGLKWLVEEYKRMYKEHFGEDFPTDPYAQLQAAIKAVFNSWNGKRAVDYRIHEGIPHDWGTAVNVCTMVFGNMGNDSGTGVAFTRDPSTGEKVFYGDYLINAQGEDVVAGIRNTKPVRRMGEDMPEIYQQLLEITQNLERHYRDMQDTEFTIERGKLWMLQTRNGKRTSRAAIKIAVDMANEGLITREEAVMRVTPKEVDTLLHPQFDAKDVEKAKEEGRLLSRIGVNASPGAAVGMLAFDADTAEAWKKEGKDVIMIRPETKPEDVHGMVASKGILTSRGGATAHAAVVARQFGIPAVVGARDLDIDVEAREVRVNGMVLKEGDWASLDGATAEVFAGKIALTEPDFDKEVELRTLLEWADAIAARENVRRWPGDYKGFPTRGLQVWTNADYPKDARRARLYGAKGIGLCRTEHMFFEQERLPFVQQMILNADAAQALFDREKRLQTILNTGKEEGANITAERREEVAKELETVRAEIAGSEAVKVYRDALAKLLPSQRSDFYGLFEAMDGYPVIIRLIDPPLHEFLPGQSELIQRVTFMEAKGLTEMVDDKGVVHQLDQEKLLLAAVEKMHEANPMMGLRGIRLGITYPDITKMQVRAIFEAACDATLKGISVHPEVMIPLTGHVNELAVVQEELEAVAKQVMAEKGVQIDYKFGTMIEIPRAALTSSEIARYAQFYSFGTNDLTQMTYGYSRDDAERRFLAKYVESGILPNNPFQQLDRDGVGKLMQMCVRDGRQTRPGLECGICGEHGGDPSSIEFCHLVGLNYVSCSPFRVPVARLAAAQAVLKHS